MNIFLIFLQILIFQYGILLLSSNTLEVDVSWDFYDNQGLSGWGNSTSTEMNMEVKAEYGELKCIIKGLSPKLESPSLFLSISTRHYAIIRAKYKGSSQNARLLLRSGGTLSPNEQLLVSKSYWEQRQSIVIVSASPSATQPHNLSYDKPYNQSFLPSNLVDGQPETYYLSNNSAGVSIVIDLGTYRWINGFRVLPYGDNSSPKRCLLQYSITTGLGPYQTALSFTVQKNQDIIGNTIQQGFHEQRFTGFNGNARYWRFVVIDNHNGKGVGIREIALDGYDERVTVVPFSLDNSGEYQNYYLPIHTYLQGMLLRMRLEIMHIDNIEINPHKYGPLFQESLVIDHIRIIRAPEVWKVRGCLDKYFESASYQNPQYNISSHVDVINNHLPLYSFTENNLTLKYATTYDCPLKGGIPITIEGINFGFHPNVYIGNKSCQVLSNQVSSIDGRIQQLICTLPSSEVRTGYQRVRVENGVHPGLFHDLPSSLSYRVAPPVPTRPMITNICANKVDLVWNVPGNEFDQMTVTGYKIIWFQPKFRVFVNNITVGNITTTSIRGLTPATEYVFAIAAVSEGVEYTNLPTDLYGRRDLVSDAFIGEFSIFTNITATLLFDFDFNFFNGNSTLNHSSATVGNSLGPTGQYGAEGQYGLVLVGSANVQNCNVSSTCCDGYNSTIGPASCGTTKSVCAVLPARQLAYDLVIDGITRSGVISNLDYSNGQPAALSIFTLEELKANKGAALPSVACGPALRLTPSLGRSSGASWYRRKVNVREGFDTYIKFQISNPSQKCLVMDDVNTYCRSRGADGLAFVIQNVAPDALGSAGSGIGYEGIFNSLAVEIDTFFNYENMDFYENHISVMTQGYRYNITANHSRSLANTNRIPDLTDGIHTIRVKYDPNFDEKEVPNPAFQVNGYTTWFINNADFKYGGQGDWGTGFGLLSVFLDDMYSPVLITPLNLAATLKLDDGRSYVGITAATGAEHWQAHDVLSWQFSSLYIDEAYYPPVKVNNQGDYQCVNETECVHNVDYDHYNRKNNIWGKGSDSTEGWMTGTEGFCSTC